MIFYRVSNNPILIYELSYFIRFQNIDAILDNQKFKDNDTDNILDHE